MAKKKENAYEMKLKAQLAETLGSSADGMQTADDRDSDVSRGAYYKEFIKVVELSNDGYSSVGRETRWRVERPRRGS